MNWTANCLHIYHASWLIWSSIKFALHFNRAVTKPISMRKANHELLFLTETISTIFQLAWHRVPYCWVRARQAKLWVFGLLYALTFVSIHIEFPGWIRYHFGDLILCVRTKVSYGDAAVIKLSGGIQGHKLNSALSFSWFTMLHN